MNKTYIFAIGGTGARVVKSLTFLLASGVDAGNRRIVPIFIDPDQINGDGAQTHELLSLYRDIRKGVNGQAEFFKTPIEEHPAAKNWNVTIDSDSSRNDDTFQDKIGYMSLPKSAKQLTELLFGEKLLTTTLEKGYLGNPNMGSVALSMMLRQPWFAKFADEFTAEDEIFVVASLFGGTGAAGLPLLINSLHNPEQLNVSKPEFLRNARKGALLVQPYFNLVSNHESAIDQRTFMLKTKAALDYYRTGGLTEKIDNIYSVGDPLATTYENHDGGREQRNRAQMTEVVGALAIINFLRQEGGAFNLYGMEDNQTPHCFRHFVQSTRELLLKPMVQYAYTTIYLEQYYSQAIRTDQYWTRGKGENAALKDNFRRNNTTYRKLAAFNARFLEWLGELADHESRPFTPFNLDVAEDQLHTFVNQLVQRKVRSGGLFKKLEWSFADQFTTQLNKHIQELSAEDPMQLLLRLFYQATEDIYQKRIQQ